MFLAALVTAITAWVTACIGFMGDFVESITATGHEILLLAVVCVPLVGVGAGLLKRLISIRA